MRSVNPRHRYDAIYLKERAPETELERSLFVALHGSAALDEITPHRPWNDVIDPNMVYPMAVHQSPEIRGILEAFLLASDNESEIGNALAMPVDEVAVYRHLFFDTEVFRTDLELMSYMRTIPEKDPNKPLYKIAYHQGLGALRWHFCRNKGSVEPEEVIHTIMTDAYYRSLEHRGLPITSKVAKEALKLARVSLDCARTLTADREVSKDTSESLKFKFEKVRDNRSIDDFRKDLTKQGGSAQEILH